MLLKVLSILWLSYGAPFAQDLSKTWLANRNNAVLVKAAILEANDRKGLVGEIEARALSKMILRASECFEIDPIVFTALIWRESHFQHSSKSETGAVGLTQLTKTGIHEVLDRVALESPRRKDILRLQMAACYPSLIRKIPLNTDVVDFSEWKTKVARSPELAIVFGAALLKIKMNSDYRQALERYNGDPKVKVRFAKDVLTLASWISSSFTQIPEQAYAGNSKFLTSIQGF